MSVSLPFGQSARRASILVVDGDLLTPRPTPKIVRRRVKSRSAPHLR
jgi:hypothetical protein